MPTSPRNLEELRKVADPAERARAAIAYETERLAAVAEARQIRDDAIRRLVHDNGVTAAARLVGMSASHVKTVRKAKP